MNQLFKQNINKYIDAPFHRTLDRSINPSIQSNNKASSTRRRRNLETEVSL